MATEIAKAYVQIIPSAQGMGSNIAGIMNKETAGAGESAGKSIGSSLVGTLGKVIAAAGLGKLIADSLSAGGDLQQSFGGLETIYGDAADGMKDMAAEAAKAGISMNNYAEQAVSFGASLKQAFGDDIQGAAKAADQAIMDMADNSAKMGTDIQSIQNAYQGFAKQNYTMLDNLKLGYGGTKTEMERLLADAEQLSGVKYDINNLGDVYAAIHVIQDELGLTGVAADEAANTFTGSLGAMKANFQNLLATITTGGDIGPALMGLFESGFNFLVNNLAPMLTNFAQQLPTVITSLITQFAENGQSLLEAGLSIITALAQSLAENLPVLIPAIVEMLLGIVDFFIDNIDLMVDCAIQLVMGLANGLIEALPIIIEKLPDIVMGIVEGLVDNAPLLLEAAFQLVVALGKALIQAIPQLLNAVVEIVKGLGNFIKERWPEMKEAGKELLNNIKTGIINQISTLADAAKQLIQKIKDAIKQKISEITQIGKDIVEGLKNGIAAKWNDLKNWFMDKISGLWDGVKNFFGIHSPSTLFMWAGEMIDEGFTEGMKNFGEDALGNVEKSVEGIESYINGTELESKLSVSTQQMVSSQYVPVSQTTEPNEDEQNIYNLVAQYLPIIAAKCGVNLELDTKRLFRTVVQENNAQIKLTGQNLLAGG